MIPLTYSYRNNPKYWAFAKSVDSDAAENGS